MDHLQRRLVFEFFVKLGIDTGWIDSGRPVDHIGGVIAAWGLEG